MGVDVAGNCYFRDGDAVGMPRVIRFDAGSGVLTSFIDSNVMQSNAKPVFTNSQKSVPPKRTHH